MKKKSKSINKNNSQVYKTQYSKEYNSYDNSYSQSEKSYQTSSSYGFKDPAMFSSYDGTNINKWTAKKTIALILAIIFLIGLWLALDYKLLFGKDWISDTYDNPDWRTNEGNLHTFGAWDIESHIWKTEFILENFPHFNWNPYWYLGMPLLKYYQSGFYIMNIFMMKLAGVNAARAALLLVIFGHLLVTLLTFLVCYKVSKRIWASALAASFLLSNTFLSLRSYGWEPITVVFIFLYPLGLYLFLKEPLRPFRFWLILVLGLSFIAHPLIWFSLCMFMGIYLVAIALKKNINNEAKAGNYIWQFISIVGISLLIGGLQFLPQMSYEQVTSGAHMGVKYLPFYQVPPNIINLQSFFFDAGNLKGPGPIIMMATFLLLVFAYIQYLSKNKLRRKRMDASGDNLNVLTNAQRKKLHQHEIIFGTLLVLFFMVLFYYMELYNIFPMNVLRSIQYHRIIPEFVITAAILIAAMSNMIKTYKQKVIYYSMLIAFVAASGIIIFSVQSRWITSDEISSRPEFIHEPIEGRITMPYTDQSFAVRNSFTHKPQIYGYYEQGIINAYTDEIFSVSSGYHNAKLTTLYLKATNTGRLYVNIEEGERDRIVTTRLNGTLPYIETNNSRYNYFKIDLVNPNFAQAVSKKDVDEVQILAPQCRVMFMEEYCGSVGEEFVSTDLAEIEYLTAYVNLLESPYNESTADFKMVNPDYYRIDVKNAQSDTAIIVKMAFDKGFTATINNKKYSIEPVGPDFMLISPGLTGDYSINLKYSTGKMFYVGLAVSIITLLSLIVYFSIRNIKHAFGRRSSNIGYENKRSIRGNRKGRKISFQRGDMKV
jgi:hypothetical protein